MGVIGHLTHFQGSDWITNFTTKTADPETVVVGKLFFRVDYPFIWLLFSISHEYHFFYVVFASVTWPVAGAPSLNVTIPSELQSIQVKARCSPLWLFFMKDKWIERFANCASVFWDVINLRWPKPQSEKTSSLKYAVLSPTEWCMYRCLSVCSFTCRPVCCSVGALVCPSVHPSVRPCPSVRLSAYLPSVRSLFGCPSVSLLGISPDPHMQPSPGNTQLIDISSCFFHSSVHRSVSWCMFVISLIRWLRNSCAPGGWSGQYDWTVGSILWQSMGNCMPRPLLDIVCRRCLPPTGVRVFPCTPCDRHNGLSQSHCLLGRHCPMIVLFTGSYQATLQYTPLSTCSQCHDLSGATHRNARCQMCEIGCATREKEI